MGFCLEFRHLPTISSLSGIAYWVHTMSHHHTYYVTSSYILCHIIIHIIHLSGIAYWVHTMSHHHTYYVTSSYILCHIIIQVPSAYYADLRQRLAASSVEVKEDLDKIEQLNILVDFDEEVCSLFCHNRAWSFLPYGWVSFAIGSLSPRVHPNAYACTLMHMP